MDAILTARHHAAARPAESRRLRPAATFAVIVMMLAAPIVAWQGPVHTTVMDAVIILFLGAYWAHMIAHRATLAWPLLGAFWAIMAGSLIGMFSGTDVPIAMLVLGQDVYLYLWFVTTVHFFVHRSRLDVVAIAYVAVACLITLLAVADHYTHALGGLFTATARATGTFENPNMFGNYLNIGIFLAWALGKGGQRVMYLALPILLLGVVATGSNGTVLSLALACVAVIASYPTRMLRERLGIVLLVAALGISVFGIWDDHMTDALLQRMSSNDRSAICGSAVEGAEDRFPIWMDALESLKEHPLGVGPANFNQFGGPVSKTYHGPHNEYVGMLVERSPLGLAGWVAMLVCLALAVNAARAAASALPLAVEPLFGVVAVVAVHAGTMEVFHFRHVWLAFAIVAAVAVQAERVKRTMSFAPTGLRVAA
jgi:O-antigen ligase